MKSLLRSQPLHDSRRNSQALESLRNEADVTGVNRYMLSRLILPGKGGLKKIGEGKKGASSSQEAED